jgi:hypothetical protein
VSLAPAARTFNCQHLSPYLIQHSSTEQPDEVGRCVDGFQVGAGDDQNSLSAGHCGSEVKETGRSFGGIASHPFDRNKNPAASALVPQQSGKGPQLAPRNRPGPRLAFHDERAVQEMQAFPSAFIPEIQINLFGFVGAFDVLVFKRHSRNAADDAGNERLQSLPLLPGASASSYRGQLGANLPIERGRHARDLAHMRPVDGG